MLLAITLLILVNLLSFDDILDQIYILYVIAIASAESVISFGILVAFYRFHSFLISVSLFCDKKTDFLTCVVQTTYKLFN